MKEIDTGYLTQNIERIVNQYGLDYSIPDNPSFEIDIYDNINKLEDDMTTSMIGIGTSYDIAKIKFSSDYSTIIIETKPRSNIYQKMEKDNIKEEIINEKVEKYQKRITKIAKAIGEDQKIPFNKIFINRFNE